LPALAAILATKFLDKEIDFEPRPGPFIALAVFGFITAVIGHLTASKTIIVTGIALVCAGIFFAPLAAYLAGQG
jgi:hypothetical protein